MIYLKDILILLNLNVFVDVYDEFNKLLYHGNVAALLNLKQYNYLKTCPVVATSKNAYENIKIYVVYD